MALTKVALRQALRLCRRM